MSDLIRAADSPFEGLKKADDRGEYWMARELMPPTGYSNWQNFQRAINDARAAMAEAGYHLPDHFSLVPVKTAGRTGTDYRLTRTACHFVFINGDPRKPEIAAAQQYFVLQTQRMEAVQQAMSLPTHIEALRGWADALEAQQRAELLQAQAEAERDELRPPAEAWNTLADTGQDYAVRDAAYILKRDPAIAAEVGPRRLFDWIVRNGMAQRRSDGSYVPYADHSDHLRLKPQSRPDTESGGRKEAHAQLRVTVKGLEYIQQRLREQVRPELLAPPEPRREPIAGVTDLHTVRTRALRR